MVLPAYCTREEVKDALDFKETARANAALDRAIQGARDAVDSLCNRTFVPTVATKFFDWPDVNSPKPWRLWLDESEVITVTQLVSGGSLVSPSLYLLEPNREGPPFDRIEINRAGTATFNTGLTPQQNIALTGVFGFDLAQAPAGNIVGSLTSSSQTSFPVTDSSALGVHDLLTIEAERMIVTGKSMLSTGQSITADVAASANVVIIPTSSSTTAVEGEIIMIDAEKMRVAERAGNSLIVKRAVDGSVLAAHTNGAQIFAPRTVTVARGALGTGAATHGADVAITRQDWPSAIRQLAVAESVAAFLQEAAGMARTSGSGDNEFEVSGKSLKALRANVYATYGRKARKYAV